MTVRNILPCSLAVMFVMGACALSVAAPQASVTPRGSGNPSASTTLQGSAAATLAASGDGHGIPPCSSCHGAGGEGNAAAGFPRLAGLPATYLAAQLNSMANGDRQNAVMEPIARQLSAGQRVRLAGFYAGLPPVGAGAGAVEAAPPGTLPVGDAPVGGKTAGEAPVGDAVSTGQLGDRLALYGRGSDEIPGCVQCHGERGSGVGTVFPPLAGQPAGYIVGQLQAWKQGTRKGEPLGLMQGIAGRLSEQDMRGVADYFAAQAVGRARGTQAAGVAQAPAGVTAATVGSSQASAAPTQSAAGGATRATAGQTEAAAASTHTSAGSSGSAVARGSVVSPSSGSASSSLPDSARGQTFTPSDRPIPDDEFGKVVQLGRQIFDDPTRYASQYVGNELHCESCHLDEGRRTGSAPLWAAYVSYPAYRAKNHHVNTLEERLQGCFRFSMNGKAPPLGDPVLVALETYAYWMALGAPVDPKIAGRGYQVPAKPALPADYERGSKVYARNCALCHGGDGTGQRDNEGHVTFPALWGPGSFNWGAGMGNVGNAAGFVKSNMPLGRGGTLSDQEAWDVAQFMDSHERPQDPRYVGTVAETRAQFHDDADSMYGKTVNGHLLGSDSVAAGGSRPAAVP
jgi:thiosulfate dehydrogenase